MRITHGPTLPLSQTSTASARSKKASSSMSKRAPKAVDVPVRRATHPSMPSRIMATVATTMIHQYPESPGGDGCSTSAVTGSNSVARPRVTRLAAPSP